MNLRRLHILLLLLIFFKVSIGQARTLSIEYQVFKFESEKQIHTYSHPRVKFNGTEISGNWLDYDKNLKVMDFTGNIIVNLPGVLMTATKATVDLNTSIATLYQATMYDQINGVFVEASKIVMINEDRYIIHNGSITRCKPESKAWEIRGRRITYLRDNFAYSLSTSIHFYSFPVFYSPFFSWPTKRGRSTGFLAPTYSVLDSSDTRKSYGWRLQVPFFIDLDKDHDLTVTGDFIQRRGAGVNLDYRYAFTQGMSGEMISWYLDENQNDRELEGEYPENLGNLDPDSDPIDLQPTRYKYTYNHRQNISLGGQLFFHQHENSDNEINKEYFGSEKSMDSHFDQSVNLVFPWSRGSLSLSYQTADDFSHASIYDKANDKETHLNTHPSLSISQGFSGIGGTPLSLGLSGNLTNYERKFGWNGIGNTGGYSLGFPFFIDFLNVQPSFSRSFYEYNVRYVARPDEEISQGVEDQPKSFGWHIDSKSLSINFEIFRFFHNQNLVRVRKLSFVPSLTFQETDDIDQSLGATAGFASSVMSTKSLTYNLSTSLLTKNPASGAVRTFLNLNLTQIYNLNSVKDKVFFNPQPENPETELGDQQLPLRISLGVSPVAGFSAGLFYRFDHHEDRVIETKVGFLASAAGGNSFSLSYVNNTRTYRELDNTYQPAAQGYSITHKTKLSDRLDLSLTGSWDLNRKNLSYLYAENPAVKRLDRQLTELGVSLLYRHSCYNFTASYSENIITPTVRGVQTEVLEGRVALTVTLPVLSGVGSQTGPGSGLPYSLNYLLF